MNVGGDLAFFTVERVDGTAIRNVDVLSCGNGQYGGLGNALFSNAQSVPVRTKAVSGLLECNVFTCSAFCFAEMPCSFREDK